MRFIGIVLLLFLSVPAHAGVIYGTLRVGTQPLAQHKLVITCSGQEFKGSTNARGSYSVKVTKTGKCSLTLSYGGSDLQRTVYSESRPARYDLDVNDMESR